MNAVIVDLFFTVVGGALVGWMSAVLAYRAKRRSLEERDRQLEAAKDPELAYARKRARDAAHRAVPELVG